MVEQTPRSAARRFWSLCGPARGGTHRGDLICDLAQKRREERHTDSTAVEREVGQSGVREGVRWGPARHIPGRDDSSSDGSPRAAARIDASRNKIVRCKSEKTWANIRRNGDEACEKAPINTGGYTTEIGDMHAPTTMWLRGRSRCQAPSIQSESKSQYEATHKKWRTGRAETMEQ